MSHDEIGFTLSLGLPASTVFVQAQIEIAEKRSGREGPYCDCSGIPFLEFWIPGASQNSPLLLRYTFYDCIGIPAADPEFLFFFWRFDWSFWKKSSLQLRSIHALYHYWLSFATYVIEMHSKTRAVRHCLTSNFIMLLFSICGASLIDK